VTYHGNSYELFPRIARPLIDEAVDDQTMHDVLAALMDHIGVPALLLENYRRYPAIVALFAERGVRFATPEEAEAVRHVEIVGRDGRSI
jgi:hypothetical protein